MKVCLSQMINNFFTFYDYYIHYYNYKLIEAKTKKKKWIQLNLRDKVYDLQTIYFFYEQRLKH